MEILRGADPFDIFGQWLAEARETELNDAEAMSLATVSAVGQPSVRMVLLKNFDKSGFSFYTNMTSRKSGELKGNPKAALCFHWKSRLRQVRVDGVVEEVTAAEADEYFATRHPLSKLGAWASAQSQPLESRDALVARVATFEHTFADGNIPRPPHWSGWRVVPSAIEFWQQGDGRLHDRFLFSKDKDAWNVTRLNP